MNGNLAKIVGSQSVIIYGLGIVIESNSQHVRIGNQTALDAYKQFKDSNNNEAKY